MTGRDAFDTLAPEFAVEINGAPLPAAALADLVSLTVDEDLNQPAMCSFVLGAWDTAQMKPKWIDDVLMKIGNPVSIAIGYRDHTLPIFAGEMTAMEPRFVRAKPPVLTVRCFDPLHRLMRGNRSTSHVQRTDSDIAAEVASRHGLRAAVHDTVVVLPMVMQHNQSDLEFLRVRAQRNGYELFVRDRELQFRPPATDAAPVLTLHPEVELLEFQPRLSSMGQVSSVEVRGWSAQDKQAWIGRSDVSDAGPLMGGRTSGPEAVRKAFDAAVGVRTGTPLQSAEEADAMARRAHAAMALHTVEAEGLCIGEPRLRIGTNVAVEGVGERFGGHYYLVGVQHRYGPATGYRTRFRARRNAT